MLWRRTPSDRRTCWDCTFTLVLPDTDDINKVDRHVLRLGWKYLQYRGTMVCPDCWRKRKADISVHELEDLPF